MCFVSYFKSKIRTPLIQTQIEITTTLISQFFQCNTISSQTVSCIKKAFGERDNVYFTIILEYTSYIYTDITMCVHCVYISMITIQQPTIA